MSRERERLAEKERMSQARDEPREEDERKIVLINL